VHRADQFIEIQPSVVCNVCDLEALAGNAMTWNWVVAPKKKNFL
jgi:hypothetical protein